MKKLAAMAVVAIFFGTAAFAQVPQQGQQQSTYPQSQPQTTVPQQQNQQPQSTFPQQNQQPQSTFPQQNQNQSVLPQQDKPQSTFPQQEQLGTFPKDTIIPEQGDTTAPAQTDTTSTDSSGSYTPPSS